MSQATAAARIVRSLRSGQITIPAEFRRQLGINEHTLLEVRIDGDELRIRPTGLTYEDVGSPWLKELYDLFAPMREALSDLPDEEVNELIDQAVREVREQRAARRP
jgi:AbrB family looped-hinge helix DNA binding protein